MVNIIDNLQKRGSIEQITSQDLKNVIEKSLSFYLGVDPTADSLHLGHLVGIINLIRLQKCGHLPYILIGGATGKIGDPSGKSKERPFLDDLEIASNVKAIKRLLEKIFVNSQVAPPVFVNNNDWLGSMSLVDFMRDIGRYFRVGSMLAKESIKVRLASVEGMSFTEFSYLIFQAYDFYYLSHRYGITLQIGGSDQWGNITAGIELARKLSKRALYGLTFPLLTTSDKKKFGKTEEGTIWLCSEKLSPYHFYQYLIKVSDKDVINFMKMLTLMDLQEIEYLEKQMAEPHYVANTAQKRLAREVTHLVHGFKGLQTALRVTEGISPGSDAELKGNVLKRVASDMPHLKLPYREVIGQKFVDILAKTKVISSKSEAIRLIKNGGAYLNNERISDISFCFARENLIDDTFLLIGIGKKKKVLISLIS